MLKNLSITITAVICRLCEATSGGCALPAGAARTASVVLALLAVAPAHAIGLGEVRVQSALGQPLRATLRVLGEDAAGKLVSCFSARLSSADGAFIVNPRLSLTPAGGITLNVSTVLPMGEPALALLVEVGCGDAVRKEFSLLLDPPLTLPGVPVTAAQNPQRAVVLPVAAVQPAARASASAKNDNPGTGSRVARKPAPAHPAALAQTVAQPAKIPASLTAVDTAAVSARNVLRLSSRNASDTDLINAIGLRLALTDRLIAPGTPANVAPDPAKAAADRAAQARFSAVLKDDPSGEGSMLANEQKLIQLQKKMQALETEAARVKQASARDAAAAAAQNDILWTAILVGLVLLVAAAIAWLLVVLRRKRHAERDSTWQWEENLSAVDPHPESTPAEPSFLQPAPAAKPSATQMTGSAPVVANVNPTREPLAAPAYVSAKPAPVVPPLEFLYETPIAASARAVSVEPAAPARPVLDTLPPELALEPTIGGAHEDLKFPEIAAKNTAVEEISDVMQEAEFWISLRDSRRAAEVLEPYATLEQAGSPLPWLYLFDLYIELGEQEKYASLQDHFQRIFNGRVLPWNERIQKPDGIPDHSIEDVPHVMEKIISLWAGEEIVAYLESLLIDDRDGNRVGFDLAIYKEIVFLIGIAHELAQSDQMPKPAIGTSGWNLAA